MTSLAWICPMAIVAGLFYVVIALLRPSGVRGAGFFQLVSLRLGEKGAFVFFGVLGALLLVGGIVGMAFTWRDWMEFLAPK